jgi:hypothetical protein
MNKQKGVSLSGLLVICVLLIAVLLIGFKLFPAYAEFFKVRNAINEISHSPELKGSTKELQAAFERHAAIDSISVINSNDLEFTKGADGYEVSAAWSVKVPLFSNISACLDFEARAK